MKDKVLIDSSVVFRIKLVKKFLVYLFIIVLSTTSCSSEKDSEQPQTKRPTVNLFQTNTKKPSSHSGNREQPGADYEWVPLWVLDSNLTVPRMSPAVVAAGGYIYVLGGGTESDKKKSIYSSVEFARIQQDGSLGPWKLTSSMNTKRIFAAALEANGYIYVMGGEKGYAGTSDLLNTVERAKIQPDGSLGAWKLETNSMNSSRRALVVSFHNGWIYAFGGYNGYFLKDMERTRINPDGSVQKWIQEQEKAKNKRYIHSGIIYKNSVYLLGGHATSPARGTDTVEWATINSNGEIGSWSNLPLMPTKRFGGDAVVLHDAIYVIGGQNTIPLSAIDKVPILTDGSLGEWLQDTPLPSSRVGASIAVWNDVLYTIGGFNSKEKYLREVLRTYYVHNKRLGMWTNDPTLIETVGKTEDSTPLDAENHFSRGIQRFNERKYTEAILELQLGLKVKQTFTPEPYNLMGLAYHKKKQYQKAIDQYKTAILSSPKFAPAYFNLAETYHETGQVKEAENLYRGSIRLKPEFLEAKIKLLSLLVETDRCADAEPELSSLAEANPANETIQSLKNRCKPEI